MTSVLYVFVGIKVGYEVIVFSMVLGLAFDCQG